MWSPICEVANAEQGLWQNKGCGPGAKPGPGNKIRKRFHAREQTGFKRFKITEEDWRNREKWEQYELAVIDMVDRTSTDYAPWTLIEANNKYFARIKVLKTVCTTIEAKLKELYEEGVDYLEKSKKRK
ncbi:hypothetical protein [Desulfosarcina ovata]|uniref:Polyphosphate kinase-2-related domain-containing protein n=1 Tax=Desulfosarcina ovata subsp. ovata TaxID=2752305 RepID=A0A5K8AJ02_9BACT|nr:hypothetical protein [Desulfosarcina ovata]BBO91724.1 hypothetical protein DSCOOX_49040 [Desulfosarcina ovata subsp. ovata]